MASQDSRSYAGRREQLSPPHRRSVRLTTVESTDPDPTNRFGLEETISLVEPVLQALAATPDLTLASELFLGVAQKLADCQIASVFSIDDSMDEVTTLLFASTLPVRNELGYTRPLRGSHIKQCINGALPRIRRADRKIGPLEEAQPFADTGIKSSLWTPLVDQGHSIVVIALHSQRPNAFDSAVVAQVEALGGAMTPYIASSGRNLQMQRQQKFAEALSRSSKVLNSTLDTQEALEAICQEYCELLCVSQAVLREFQGEELVCRLVWPPATFHANGNGNHEAQDRSVVQVPAPLTLARDSAVIHRLEKVPQAQPTDGLLSSCDNNSVMTLPLTVKDQVIGNLEISHVGTGRKFTKRCREVAEALATQAALALQNARLDEEANRQKERADTALAGLQASHSALRTSQTQHNALLDAVPDAMFRISKDGTYLDFSTPADFDLWAPPEEFLGKTISEVMPEDIALRSGQAISRALSSHQVQTMEYQLCVRDRVREYEARIVANGENEVLAMVRDVTDRKLLEAQFLQSQKLESLGRLAGGIAHDFNNLLGGIMGYASLLKARLDPSSDAHEFANIIEIATQRGAQLTQQLLTAARKSPFDAKPVDVNEVMREVVQMLTHTLPKAITVADRLQPDLQLVHGDQTQIHQVLMNLCINAADAMPDGGRLTLTSQEVLLDEEFCRQHFSLQPGPYIQVIVEDTGVGITEEDQTKIFDPFYTTKDPGKGTGLGLAVVYAIVKNHLGMVEVSSTPGQGSVFTVYLPVSSQKPT